MKHEIVVQLYLKRIKNVQKVIEGCIPNSWAENYWIEVSNKLQNNLDSYLIDEGIFE